jgi:transcriptional regulator with XRE-family HTH domain
MSAPFIESHIETRNNVGGGVVAPTHNASHLKVQSPMGNPRPRPKLLPQKLVLIREYLNLTQSQIKEALHLSQAARPRVSEYENGKRTPPLEVVLGYSRLARVPMESLVDDKISLSQLGTFDYEQLLQLEKLAVERKHTGQKKRVPKLTE